MTGEITMAHVSQRYKEDCGCGRCSTYAELTHYSCGCVEVEIFNDQTPCDECTDFSGQRERCGDSGHPDDHAD